MIGSLKRALDAEVSVEHLAEELARHESSLPGDDLRRLASVLADVIRSVPDALAHVLALAKDEHCGRAVAFATGSILNYLFDPDDLLPESGDGHLGLLDDAYLVHIFVTRLTNAYPFVNSSITYDAPSDRSLATVASLLPDGVAQSLARTSETIISVAHALFAPGANGRAPELEYQLDIRVAGAIHTLDGFAAD